MTERLTDAAIREAKHASAMAQLAEVVALTEATTPGLAIETLDVNCRGMKVKFTHPKTDTVNMSNPQYVRLAFRSFGAFAGHLKQALEEVERLTRERDEAEGARILNANALKAALAANEAMGREDYLNKQAIRVGGDAVRELNAEVARLRAAALPEDAEERIARTCFEWDRGATWDERTNSDVENYTDQARAVLAALRGDA